MKINSWKFLTAAVVGAAGLPFSISADPVPAASRMPDQTAVTPADVPASTPAIRPITFTEPEILACVTAIDKNEVAAAKTALKKKMGKEAESFAKLLRDEHKDNQEKTEKLAKDLKLKEASSPTSLQLTANGKDELKALSDKKGADFEKAYIDAMIKGHTEALQLIDGDFLTAGRSEAVKAYLNEVRTHVAMHLEQAKRLQGARASREE